MKRENANVKRDLIHIAIIATMIAILLVIAGHLQKAHAADRTITFTWQQVLPDPNDLAGWELDTSLDGATWLDAEDLIDISFSTEEGNYTTDRVLAFPDAQRTTLYARIRAYDEAGNRSDWSDTAQGDIDLEGPDTPSTFTFTIGVAPQ